MLALLEAKHGAQMRDLIALAAEFIAAASDADIASISSASAPTPCAALFESAITAELKPGQPCFWSCKNGKDYARTSGFLTDSDQPVIRMLFDLCAAEVKSPRMTQFSFAVSRIFARTASGVVNIYMGSDKATEPVGFHVGNNLWSAELPVLYSLMHAGIVTKIQFNILDGATIARVLTDPAELSIWRRNWHPMDPPATKTSFTDWCAAQSDWDTWRLTPPREYITVAVLRRIIASWKTRAG